MTQSEEDLKDELFRFLNCYQIEASEISNGMTYIDSQEAEKICRELMELFDSYTKEAVREALEEERQDRLIDWIEQKDPVEVMNFLAAVIYTYVMEPTNAFEFKTTLEGFNKKDVILGDFTITAELKQQETGGE